MQMLRVASHWGSDIDTAFYTLLYAKAVIIYLKITSLSGKTLLTQIIKYNCDKFISLFWFNNMRQVNNSTRSYNEEMWHVLADLVVDKWLMCPYGPPISLYCIGFILVCGTSWVSIEWRIESSLVSLQQFLFWVI